MIPIYKSSHLICLSAPAKFYSYLMHFRHGIKYVLQLVKKENSVNFRMSKIKKRTWMVYLSKWSLLSLRDSCDFPNCRSLFLHIWVWIIIYLNLEKLGLGSKFLFLWYHFSRISTCAMEGDKTMIFANVNHDYTY